MRLTVALASLFLVSCGSTALGPTPSPAPSSSAGGTATATAVATASPTIAPSATPTPTPGASVSTPIPMPSYADIAPAGNGVVWTLVAGSHLFRSADRGTTWEERSLPALPQIVKISFVDDRNGWILTTGSPETGCNGQFFAVWRTTDGAATWSKAYESGSPPDPGCKTAVAFADTSRGYVDVSGRDVAPRLLRTVDGGTSWASTSRLPDPPGVTWAPSSTTLAPGSVADFGSVLLVSARSEASGDARQHAYRSTDGGRTWSYVARVPLENVSLVFLTPTRWIQIANLGSQETTDGGVSWHAFATDYMNAAPIAPYVAFGDALTGYATVRGTIARTTDGGAHWTALKTPGT